MPEPAEPGRLSARWPAPEDLAFLSIHEAAELLRRRELLPV